MKNLPEIFAQNVFNNDVMLERLPKETYKSLKKTVELGFPIGENVANVVANAMKDWAIEKGATHYTHWFQPMTGITAEKHDSFLSPQKDGNVIMEFSGKELIKGEPDASSFPSGGIRATFEARGYTAWDPTSYAFIKDNTLFIPTAFCSYSGECLDKKTPLLRSMEVLDKQAKRILKLFGTTVKRVSPTVGAEQEYFLIDKEDFLKRKDLIFTGRTLFGAKAPKGQELEDHYFGTIKPRISSFMKELDEELWKLGVFAKTEHNEAAPSQHELAPVFTTTNIACDHNQLTMELMKKIADKHGLACLLHEKPFEGINGSGKHNNWSMTTDSGVNLLEPGNSPSENAQFLIFFTAVVRAVDKYQDLLRMTAASAGNDRRLSANEAPPAIISMYIGDELTEILSSIEAGSKYKKKDRPMMEIGVDALPHFPKDTTDRNRTSPFAFTGNKFEFRMLGSSFSIAGPNIVLNTIVADILSDFADTLENAENFTETLNELIIKTLKKHKKIIFNGNNYSAEWVEEAKKRGLSNLKSSSEAIPMFESKKSVDVFTRHKIFSASELKSRCEILLEIYCKTINIEACTMSDMVKQEIYPAVNDYIRELSETVCAKKKAAPDCDASLELNLIDRLSKSNALSFEKTNELAELLKECSKISGTRERADFYDKKILSKMQEIRDICDEEETLVSKKCWPFPTYSDILFRI